MKRFAILTGLLLALLPALAQKPDGLRSFEVYGPYDEVVQGDRIEIVYILEANQYRLTNFDGGMDRAVLEKLELVKPDGYEEEDYYHVEVHTQFRVLGSGRIAE